MLLSGSAISRLKLTVCLWPRRCNVTNVCQPWLLGPPARAIESRMRSPGSESANFSGLLTSPMTLTRFDRCSVMLITTCGSIARFFRRLTISLCTSGTVRPEARTWPAYGTVIFPARSTVWLGICTKLPGRDAACSGMKRPPACASNTVTATTSPTPSRISGAGGRSENAPTPLRPPRRDSAVATRG